MITVGRPILETQSLSQSKLWRVILDKALLPALGPSARMPQSMLCDQHQGFKMGLVAFSSHVLSGHEAFCCIMPQLSIVRPIQAIPPLQHCSCRGHFSNLALTVMVLWLPHGPAGESYIRFYSCLSKHAPGLACSVLGAILWPGA